MDLSKLSTADLVALQAGDLSKVSTLGLQSLHQQAFSDRVESDRAQMAKDYAPTVGMSTGERFAAGAGQGMTSVVRGVGQLLGKVLPDSVDDAIGLPTQASIDESKRLDAPLLKTGAGRAGSIGGAVTAALPTLLIPGVNGYAGAAAVGGVSGFAQPVASDEGNLQRLKNTAIGTVAGPIGVGAARAIGGVVQAGKALVQPFTQSGRNQIAGNALARFAEDPSKIAAATSTPTVTGAVPTLAEQTGDAGLAKLQDALRTLDPKIGNAIETQLANNNAARVASLQSLAGDSGKRVAAEAARTTNAAPRYAAGTSKTIEVDPALAAILERPSTQAALGRASKLAAEQGRTFGLTSATETPASAILDASGAPMTAATAVPAKVSGQTLQDLKMGMDALLKDPTSGIAGQEAIAIGNTRNELVKLMESRIPDFKAARTGYAADSKPLNGMDVGEYLGKSNALSNTSNLAGDQRLQANALLRLLRDEPKLVQSATGRKELDSLSQVLTPEQENVLRSVASEADRAAAVTSAGNGSGSATAQRLASQNVLKALIGPLGSPGGASERWTNAITDSVLGRTAASPLNIVYGRVAEPDIQQTLARAMLDPDAARAVLEAATKAGVRLPPGVTQRLTLTAARIGANSTAMEAGK